MSTKKTFKELLVELGACPDGMTWMKDRTIEEYIINADRGDWVLWLAEKLCIPFKELTLAKGHCAATIIHLMKDERSKRAVQAAIDFGNGFITKEELAAAATAATDVAAAAAAAYATATTDAAVDYAAAYDTAIAYTAAVAAASVAAPTASPTAAATAAAITHAGYAARKNNRQITADICKKILGVLIIKAVNELLI